MVTTQEIESLGWILEGIYRNGGSKGFKLNNCHLLSHADNRFDPSEIIKITRADGLVLYSDSVENKKQLIDLMVQFNIDAQLTRDIKIQQII